MSLHASSDESSPGVRRAAHKNMAPAAEAGPAVLIVDDDRAFGDAIAEILEETGYQVTVARDGREALALLNAGARPNLILLDLMMPFMNGWQLLDHIRLRSPLPPIPVVLVTAFENSATTLAWKAEACLIKPIPHDLLLATVERFTKH